eukprot:2393398-Rhodomonas_salina.3
MLLPGQTRWVDPGRGIVLRLWCYEIPGTDMAYVLLAYARATVIALRLYTGPMYVKYNAVLRNIGTKKVSSYAVPGTDLELTAPSSVLGRCYGMPGTDIHRPSVRHAAG